MKAPPADVTLKLRQAYGLHRQGLLKDAERLYRDVLAENPDQTDALHFLGLLEVQRGNLEKAIGLMDRALVKAPNNAAILYNRANAMRDAGRVSRGTVYGRGRAMRHD